MANALDAETLQSMTERTGTDVDLPNRLDKDTPLHLAARIPDPGARKHFLALLLDAGSDPRCATPLPYQA